MRQSFASVQALRGIAVLSVLLFHANIHFIYFDIFTVLRPIKSFAFFGVDIFFVISGFVLTYAASKKFGNDQEILPFLIRRWYRIFSNYWIFLIIIAILVALGLYDVSSEIRTITSILLFPQKVKYYILGVSWTLSYELFFYLVLSLALASSLRNFRAVLVIWASIVIALNLAFPLSSVTPSWYKFIFSPFHLEFIAGCSAALFLLRGNYLPWKILIISGLTVVMTTIIYTFSHPFTIPDGHFMRALCFGSGFSLIVLGLAQGEKENKFNTPPFLVGIGNASYSIYLCHIPVFQIIFRLRERFMPDFNPYLLGILLIVTPVLYGLWHHRFIEKPLLHWFRNKYG